ncbi:MAG: hypothetical protein ACRENE_02970, partial [Polyangiaceae bacterium]
ECPVMVYGNRLLSGLAFVAVFTTAALSSEVAGCGGSSTSGGGSGGHGGDGGLTTGIFGGGGASSGGGAANGSCLRFGSACAANGDCCSGQCQNSLCAYPACASDGLACTGNGDCCSQTCTGGKCVTLNATCKTLGNTCTGNAECCSALCSGGTCQSSSFCGQAGDACATGSDCCTGTCTVASGQTLGTCAVAPPSGPANCGMVDGVLCGGTGVDGGVVYKDGGLPACGGGCCSRACAPFGPTGVLVCQPASGCHVVGDLCTQDSDCCGSAAVGGAGAGNVTCTFNGDGGMGGLGVCRNPIGCKPDGDVCKLKTMSCNASCDCCAGNCETMDTCKQDNVGVPRCAPAMCVKAGGACASSASCCDHAPCVPNPDGPTRYVCATGNSCVPSCGACTNNADCCAGSSCVMQSGSAAGVCGPCNGNPPPADAGPVTVDSGAPPPADGGVCALYGQMCVTSADCCNNIPCSGGFCVVF